MNRVHETETETDRRLQVDLRPGFTSNRRLARQLGGRSLIELRSHTIPFHPYFVCMGSACDRIGNRASDILDRIYGHSIVGTRTSRLKNATGISRALNSHKWRNWRLF